MLLKHSPQLKKKICKIYEKNTRKYVELFQFRLDENFGKDN